MLGIVLAVLTVRDRQSCLGPALKIGRGWGAYGNSSVDDCLEPREVIERTFRDCVMGVCEPVVHGRRRRGEERRRQPGRDPPSFRDEAHPEVVAGPRQDVANEGLDDRLDPRISPHPGVPCLVVLRRPPAMHPSEGAIRPVKEEARDLGDVCCPSTLLLRQGLGCPRTLSHPWLARPPPRHLSSPEL